MLGSARSVRLLLLLLVLAWVTAPASAAPILHGDFDDLTNGGTVIYKQVTEDSVTDTPPLFGAPTVLVDALDFNPVSFGATASGAGGVDITDGTLSMDIWATTGNVIDSIILSERGDVQLVGLGTANTLASIAMTVFIDVIEIDGAPVSIDLGPGGTTGPFEMAFSPFGGSYDLSQNPGPLYSDSFSGTLFIDIAQELINAGFSGNATKVRVNLDNTLVALSELGTSSFIQKKDIDGITITVVPEPSAGVLLSVGLCALAARSRRRTLRTL